MNPLEHVLATLDQADQAVILRVVYDGPPEAGKTTSVRALARSFGRAVYTPEEREGRTVYFDWLEHTGGRFDGAPIRCQIVSVPGQDCWSHRRAVVLESADVVVFVGDTRAMGWSATTARLRELRLQLDARDGPPVGLVLQANHRDAPDAVGIDLLRREAARQRVALVESVALDGAGVREAFVFAVRLALDRVREAQRSGGLPGRTVEQDGQWLLQQLLTADGSGVRESYMEQASAVSGREAEPRVERPLPCLEVASGLIWPPIDGRILLREAMQGGSYTAREAGRDHLVLLGNGHRAGSPHDAGFDALEQGRSALIGWARKHASAQGLVSKGRCLVLCPGGDHYYRLWQIVRTEPTLRELFIDGCDALSPRHAARQLAHASRLLMEAQASCRVHDLNWACTLDTVGISEAGAAVYVGDVPLHASVAATKSGVQQVVHEAAALLRHRGTAERVELCRELLSLHRRDPRLADGAQLEEELSRLLLNPLGAT